MHTDLIPSKIRLHLLKQDMEHYIDPLLTHQLEVISLQLMVPRLDVVIFFYPVVGLILVDLLVNWQYIIQ